MRRLTIHKKWIGVATAFVVGALFMVSVIIGLSAHTINVKAQGSNCSTSCYEHGQSAMLGVQSENKLEDDTEPKPPSTLFGSPKVISIGLYGVAYSLIIVLIYHNRRYLLIQQLRF